jgi:hypothetical protein
MDQNSERFWMDAQVDAQKKFGQELEKHKDLNLDFWKTIIIIQATILGISISLMGYLGTSPNLFLVLTWITEITTIGWGFLLFKIHIDQYFKSSFEGFKSSWDMNEINILDARGAFTENPDKKKGLFVAALMKIPANENQFTDQAKDLASKYKNELPSEQFFKDVGKTKLYRLKEFLLRHQAKLVSGFYFFTTISFITLFLSILIR